MKELCKYPTCQRESYVRGLCENHYVYVCKLVRLGRTTWDKLVKSGKCNEKSRGRFKAWLLEE
jgi:hypothetical protein